MAIFLRFSALFWLFKYLKKNIKITTWKSSTGWTEHKSTQWFFISFSCSYTAITCSPRNALTTLWEHYDSAGRVELQKHYLKFWIILYRLNCNITLSDSIQYHPSPTWEKPTQNHFSQYQFTEPERIGHTTKTIYCNTSAGIFIYWIKHLASFNRCSRTYITFC